MNLKEAKDPIKDLIEKSGNNFHFKVVKFLKDNKWEVLISPYYTDNVTDKPREIDIIAEREFVVNEPDWNKPIGNLNVRLFIECKYINSEIVFWFDNKDIKKARKRVEDDIFLKLPSGEHMAINRHHYLNNTPVAKLSTSSSSKLQDKEIIYKALNQSLNAMVYYKGAGSIISKDNMLKPPKTLRTINYPLILCNGFDNFYKVDPEKKSGYSKINKNFQLEINYAYLDKDESKRSCTDYFLIDIINFNEFIDFLGELKKTDIGPICAKLGDISLMNKLKTMKNNSL